MMPITLVYPAKDGTLPQTKAVMEWDAPKGPTAFDILITKGPLSGQDTITYKTNLSEETFSQVGLDSNFTYCWTVRGYNEDKTSSTGWADEWCFTTPTVGVMEYNDQLSYGPNPVVGRLAVNGNGTAYIGYTILSTTGETVREESMSYSEVFEIDMQDLASGHYFLLLNTPTGYQMLTIKVE
jgi:hypothetical protein